MLVLRSFSAKSILLFGFVLFALVAFTNDGFMALDEYWVGITRYIPAQKSELVNLVSPEDVKSPMQLLPMFAVAQTAHKAGVESPYIQYRIVIAVLGLLNAILLFCSIFKLSQIFELNENERKYFFGLQIFYFGSAFALTRPMFESIAAPWLLMAAVWGTAYMRTAKIKDLLLAVLFVSISFLLRQQLGFCGLALVVLPIIKKNYKDFFFVSICGLVCFVLAGIPDLYLRGEFHYSLKHLAFYNIEHGHEYGRRSILFYPAMIVVMLFLPLFLKRYRGFMWQEFFRRNQVFIYMIFLFLILHSLFPNKWERFLISVIPLMLVLLFPFFLVIIQNHKKHRIRLALLLGLNGALFIIASFFPAQKNLIEMSRYLNSHSNVAEIYRVNETPGWITEAFVLEKRFKFVDVNAEELRRTKFEDCSRFLVIGENSLKEFADVVANLKIEERFSVNLIEHWSYKLNPKNNPRRVPLRLYSGCKT